VCFRLLVLAATRREWPKPSLKRSYNSTVTSQISNCFFAEVAVFFVASSVRGVVWGLSLFYTSTSTDGSWSTLVIAIHDWPDAKLT
jgi:hypothetical protein